MCAAFDRIIDALTERFSSNAPELLAFVAVNRGSKSLNSLSFLMCNRWYRKLYSYLGVDIDRLRGQSSAASNMFAFAGPDRMSKFSVLFRLCRVRFVILYCS